MNCENHNEKKATNTCSICGKWFCEDCVLEIGGRIYCKSCLKNKLSQDKNIESSYNPAKKKQPSDLLTLIFSFIPGWGQMYLGFMKRGIFLFVLFAISFKIYWFDYIAVILWAFAFFDTLKIKNSLLRGVYIEDNFNDITKFARENKKLLIISALLVIIPEIFFQLQHYIKKFLNDFDFDFDDLFSGETILTLILIILIIIIVKNFKKNNKQ